MSVNDIFFIDIQHVHMSRPKRASFVRLCKSISLSSIFFTLLLWTIFCKCLKKRFIIVIFSIITKIEILL